MMGNRILAEGFLPADAQVQYDQQGRARLNLRFSNQKSRKDDTGQWINESEPIWFGVTLWGADAEALGERAVKGARIKASGQLIARAYTKDGEQRTAFEIEFPAVRLDPPRQQQGGNGFASNYQPQQQGGWNQQTGRGGFGGDPNADPWATQGQQTTEETF